jgi:hypothetical protein
VESQGATLKGIMYCNHPDTELCFPGPRSDTFWTDLVETPDDGCIQLKHVLRRRAR